MSNSRLQYAKGRLLYAVLGSALLALPPWGAAHAQSDSFPGKAITVIVPIAAGATATQIREATDAIAEELRAADDGLLLIEGSNGYRIVTHPRFARWVRILRAEPPPLKRRSTIRPLVSAIWPSTLSNVAGNVASASL